MRLLLRGPPLMQVQIYKDGLSRSLLCQKGSPLILGVRKVLSERQGLLLSQYFALSTIRFPLPQYLRGPMRLPHTQHPLMPSGLHQTKNLVFVCQLINLLFFRVLCRTLVAYINSCVLPIKGL